MARHSFFSPISLLSLCASLVLVSGQTTTPTQTWVPAPTCSNGLPNPASLGGVYTDYYNAIWNVECAQDNTGFVYDAAQGTNGGGVSACFKGCDSRPGCTAFSYIGTVTGATTGAGKCYYKFAAGSYYLNSTTYAAANLISNGTPQLVCPYYNGTTYTSTDGAIWQVNCGYDMTATAATVVSAAAGSISQCMLQCNQLSDCTQFSFVYTGGEPAAGTTNNDGTCYYKKGAANVNGGGTLTVAAILRIASPTQAGETRTSTTVTTTTTSTPTTTTTTTYTPTTTTTTTTPTTTTTTTYTPTTTTTTTYSPTTTTTTSTTTSQTTTTTTTSKTTTTTTTSPTTTTTTTYTPTVTTTSTTSTTTTSTTTTSSPTTTTTTTVTSTTSSGSSSTSSGSFTAYPTSTCTAAPIPSAPSCSGQSGMLGTFTDTCGTNYTIYCGSDTNPGAAYSPQAASLLQCMQICDAYPGCRAATYLTGTCYIKTAFSGLATTQNANLVALVRYIPPNPSYPVPVSAPGTNTSTGCGSTLPAGVTVNGASVYFNIINPSDGLQRNWTIHIPQFYNPNAASPLIMAFPGNGESASNIELETGLSDGTTNPYAIVAYVNGYGLGFESNPAYAPGGTYSYVDDLGFINTLIANLTASYCIDTGKIFAVGHSNGGGFTNVLACDPVLSMKIAAFAASSGAFYTGATSGSPYTIEPVNTPVQATCSPGRNNVPFLEVHGTNDQTINYWGGPRNGRILPTIPHWTTEWATRQGFSANNYTTYPATNVTMYQFGGNPGEGQLGIITHYMLTNWIHQWAATPAAPLSMTPLLMPFFYRWTDNTRPPTYAPIVSTSSSSMSSTTSTVSSSTSTSMSLTSTTSSPSSTSMTASSTSSTSSLASSSTTSTSSSMSVTSSSSSTSSLVSTSSSVSSSSITHTTTTTTTSTSSTASASQTASGGCPGVSGSQQRNGTTGNLYTIECYMDTSGGSFATSLFPGSDYTQCFGACDSTPNCGAWTWSAYSAPSTGGICYLKTAPATFTSGNNMLVGGIIASSVVTSTTSTASTSSTSMSLSTASSMPSSSPSSSHAATTTTTTISSSMMPSGSAFASCPLNNGQAVTDNNGIQYTLGCGNDTSGGNFQVNSVTTGFTACFALCDSAVIAQGAGYCTGFTFTGAGGSVNGNGECFLKDGSGEYFMPGADPNSYVGAIRISSPFATTSSAPVMPSTSMSATSSFASSAVSSTMASPSPSSTMAVCTNGTNVADSNGITYTIYCNADTSGSGGGTFASTGYNSGDFTQCETYCDMTPGCGAWVWVPGSTTGGFCYLKDLPQSYVSGGTGYVAGIRYVPTQTPSSSPSSTHSSTMSFAATVTTTTTTSLLSTSLSSVGSSTSVSLPATSSLPTSTAVSSLSSSLPMTSSLPVTSSIDLSVSSTMVVSSSLPATDMSSSMMDMSSTEMSSLTDSASSSTMTSTDMTMPFSTDLDITTTTDVVMTMSSSMVDSTMTSIASMTESDSETSTTDGGMSSGMAATSSTTPLPPCPTAQCGVAASNQTCADPYGNTFNVTCGTQKTGTVSVRAAKANLGACLALCDTTPGCIAVNYIGTTCEALTSVTGSIQVAGAQAAERPPDVSTVYTMPMTSTTMAMGSMTSSPALTDTGPTQSPPPVYGGGSSSTGSFGNPSPYPSSSGMSMSMSMPGSTVTSLPGSYGGGSSGMSSMGSSSVSILVTPSSSIGVVGLPSTGSMSSGASNSMTPVGTQTNVGSMSGSMGTMTGGGPTSTPTAPVCPAYNGANYTDSSGAKYAVNCNSAYTGSIYERLAGSYTPEACLALCDQTQQCVAMTASTTQCVLFSSTTGLTTDVTGSTAALRVGNAPPPNSSGGAGSGVSVITVSVCAASSLGTTTVFTTSTITMGPM